MKNIKLGLFPVLIAASLVPFSLAQARDGVGVGVSLGGDRGVNGGVGVSLGGRDGVNAGVGA